MISLFYRSLWGGNLKVLGAVAGKNTSGAARAGELLLFPRLQRPRHDSLLNLR